MRLHGAGRYGVLPTGAVGAVSCVALGLVGVVVTSGPAAANGPCGNLGSVEQEPNGGTAITCVYDDTTAPTHLIAPSGVTTVTATLTGGSGGAGASGLAGAAGGLTKVVIRLPVTGIEIWTGSVGQAGKGCGGDSAGGSGGRTSGQPSGGSGGGGTLGCAGGGGGGASFVMAGTGVPGRGVPLATAGGGGGAAGSGSAVGGRGGPEDQTGAGAGGGSGGSYGGRGGGTDAAPGSGVLGGNGAVGSGGKPAGGGGGGGYLAGGGGAAASGGGGGGVVGHAHAKAHQKPNVASAGSASGPAHAGLVKITFTPAGSSGPSSEDEPMPPPTAFDHTRWALDPARTAARLD